MPFEDTRISTARTGRGAANIGDGGFTDGEVDLGKDTATLRRDNNWVAGQVAAGSSIRRVVVYPATKPNDAITKMQLYLGTTKDWADSGSVECGSVIEAPDKVNTEVYQFDCSAVMDGKTWVIARQIQDVPGADAVGFDLGEIFVFDA